MPLRAVLLFVAFCVNALPLLREVPPAAGDPSTWPLVTANSGMQYVGAFRLPRGRNGATYLNNGFDGAPDNALTFNPSGNDGAGTLFIAAAFNANTDGSIPVAEVSIPTPVGGTDPRAMPMAAVLQNLADATEGRWQQIVASGYKANRMGGLLVDNGKLYISEYVYYDANGEQSLSHVVRNSLNLSATGQVAGPFGAAKTFFSAALGNAGYVAGHMTPIPPAWQSRLGGTAITGLSMAPIISRTSFGPGAFSFTPASMAANYRANPLVYYPQTHTTLGSGDRGASPYMTLTDFAHGIAFPDGTRSLLFFGTHGQGQWCYGAGTTDQSLDRQPNPPAGPKEMWCYDPANGAKGQHAYPYVPHVWAYDANDLAAVRAGAKQPWNVMPQVWQLSTPFPASHANPGGVAYDPATRRIFIALRWVDQMQPLILVYQVQ